MGLLDAKVAIVSGIGPGMGRDIALAFAREGADVVLGGRTEKKLRRVAQDVESLGRRALPVACDIADEQACRRLVERATGELGGIDVLVNNAFHNGDFSTLLDANLDRWRETMDVNLFGALHMVRAVVPAMRERGDGRIIMVNTMSTQRIEPGWGAYAASKGALATATKTLARELGPFGIRVNAPHPGYIWGRWSGTSASRPRNGASRRPTCMPRWPTRPASSTCPTRPRSPAPPSTSPPIWPRRSPGR